MILTKWQNINDNPSSNIINYNYIIGLTGFVITIFSLFKLYYLNFNNKQVRKYNKIIRIEETEDRYEDIENSNEVINDDKELEFIDMMINKIINDFNKLSSLWDFDAFETYNDVNIENVSKNITIIDIQKNECEILVYCNNNEKYYNLYSLAKEITNREITPLLWRAMIKIINKDYNNDLQNKNIMTETLLSLYNNIKNFFITLKNNKYNFRNRCCVNSILWYTFDKYSNCDNNVIDNLLQYITQMLLNFHLCEKKKDDVNNRIKKLFDHIKNDENNLLNKLYRFEIALSIVAYN